MAHSISVQSSDPLYLHSKWASVPLYQDRCAESVVYSISDHSSELSPMDAEGIVRRPRRIAGGDHDSFGEGEDGEKLPEVGTTKNNPTPIGDVPIAMLISTALCYLLYRYYKIYIKSKIGKK